MNRRSWKTLRPTSLLEALRLCKEHAQAKRQLSVERIADLMGVSHDSLYKWLATGRMPAILIPAYELACGINYVSVWLATSAGKLVIDMPTGRNVQKREVVDLHMPWSNALQLLCNFYEGRAGREETLSAITAHLEQMAFHHHNVAQFEAPELEFDQ
ncbi:hypothetical protein [uncultured Pseudacidovorax sp.]|uniref:hypothetical protein n=1 Tax=uncultured Pseudacidovorax sp. TaxID=679313 RepID=UPI0025DB6A94|nr:hypothetical protein [uncultured Pseudacidovorax sp.]